MGNVTVEFTAQFDTGQFLPYMAGSAEGIMEESVAAHLLSRHRPEYGYVHYKVFDRSPMPSFAGNAVPEVPDGDEPVNLVLRMEMDAAGIAGLFGGDWHPQPRGDDTLRPLLAAGITCESVAAHVARNHHAHDGYVTYTVQAATHLDGRIRTPAV